MRTVLVITSLTLSALNAQYNDAVHVSACVHYGDCSGASRIAQGSVFVVFGGTRGPAPVRTVSGFPLHTNLAGASVQVTSGGRVIDALILSVEPGFTSPGSAVNDLRVRAVLPSGTPLGEASAILNYKGEITGSPDDLRMKVVPRELGLYRTGEGGIAAQNVSSSGSIQTNTYSTPATPGQLVVLWGTGLGASSGDEAAGPLPGDLGIDGLQVLVADKPARVVYAGRSGCCAGVDQIIFEVPAGVESCQTPVVVRFSDDSESNYVTLSIAANAGTCPMGLSADLTGKYLSGTLTVGQFSGSPGNVYANFLAGNYPGSYLSTMPVGSCFGPAGLGGSETITPPVSRFLDAGPSIGFRTPEGNISLFRNGIPNSQVAPFRYAATTPSDRLLPGDYGLDNGDGGPDVGAFRTSFRVPDLSFAWTNMDSLNTVRASQDLTITWTAGAPDGYVYIGGGYSQPPGGDPDYDLEGAFGCVERADKGSFTVPGSVLWRAKGSPVPNIVMEVFVARTFSYRFEGNGLDVGEFSWFAGFSKVLKVE